jgi:hypothetical protein
MTIIATCPQCARQYSVGPEFAGQQFRCPQCSATFAAPATASSQPGGYYLPNGTWATGGNGPLRTNSGPTDLQFRLGGAAAIGLGLFLAGMTYLMHVLQGEIFILPLLLIPIAMLNGIAALINPDVTRSIGIFGKHLPWQLRAIGWSVMAASLLLGLALVFGVLFGGGYRPG